MSLFWQQQQKDKQKNDMFIRCASPTIDAPISFSWKEFSISCHSNWYTLSNSNIDRSVYCVQYLTSNGMRYRLKSAGGKAGRRSATCTINWMTLQFSTLFCIVSHNNHRRCKYRSNKNCLIYWLLWIVCRVSCSRYFHTAGFYLLLLLCDNAMKHDTKSNMLACDHLFKAILISMLLHRTPSNKSHEREK